LEKKIDFGWWKRLASCTEQSKCPFEPIRLRRVIDMSGSKATPATRRKRTKPAEATPRDPSALRAKRPPKEQKREKVEPDKLVCRYCRSDDLSPSFIKRRDRRCRKCFSKRYGSGARGNKTKLKK
jgi:hypothetical protein